MITTIPFSGFYNSIHDSEIDHEIEQMISDDSGCHPISDRLNNEIWDGIEWGNTLQAYSKSYVEYFAHLMLKKFDVKLKFESKSSPREYNFQTDRIFCIMSQKDARKLRKAVKPELLQKLADECFTSRSGFISYYSPDVKMWGKLETWDHNQLGTLVAAAIEQLEDDNWEYSIIESMSGNGDINNAISLNAKGERIANIAHYLRTRQERKYRKSA